METTPVVQEYFEDEYIGHAIGLGLMWLVMSQAPFWMVEYWVLPGTWAPQVYINGAGTIICSSDRSFWGRNSWTRWAFQSMAYGSLGLFGL